MKRLKQKTMPRIRKRLFTFGLIAFLTALCVVAPASLAQLSATQQTDHQFTISQGSSTSQSLLDQGKLLYETGQYNRAAQLLQQAAQQYQSQGDDVREAIALSNLSLTYQQLGRWEDASNAVQQSLSLLELQQTTSTTQHLSVLAQTLNVQGRLQLAQGKAEQALSTWERTAALYNQIQNSSGVVQSRIYQAQAMRSLGLYHQAIAILNDLKPVLNAQGEPLEQATIWRSLGDALRVSGELDCGANATCAYAALNQSLMLAEQSGNRQAIAAAQLSLGNTARLQAAQINPETRDQDQLARAQALRDRALDFYRQAAATLPNSLTATQAQLNQLSLLAETSRYAEAAPLIPQVQSQFASLPPGRSTIDAQVNFARSLMRLNRDKNLSEPREEFSSLPSPLEIAQLLKTAYQQAEGLGDTRSQAYVLGTLGNLYEQAQYYSGAQTFTRRALSLSEAIQASDIAYQWQWQLGRVYLAQDQPKEAIAIYGEAYKTLGSLRGDLLTANVDLQFSFRDNVEPLYREYVDLLLQQASKESKSKRQQYDLEQARQVIDSLRLAELQNFLRVACLDATSQLDDVISRQDQTAALIYPIVLDDRLEVILKLPQANLIQYTQPDLSRAQMEQTLRKFRRDLQEAYTFRVVKQDGQQIYNWLVQPMRQELDQRGIKTLIFVLDGALRSIPMAALYDGEHYLIENFAVSLEIGLAVRDPEPLQRDNMRILAAGLVNPPRLDAADGNYSPLPNVAQELDFISSLNLPATILRNAQFTDNNFNQALNQAEPAIIHLATHGQFGSNPEDTFILDASGKVSLNELANLFKTEQQRRSRGIELLVLSACRTATGDSRAVLGIAGTAVQAGARSAIASLWSLNDAATVPFVEELYRQLGQPNVTRAEALRRAQLALLKEAEGDYTHPRYWSPYVLIGSWL